MSNIDMLKTKKSEGKEKERKKEKRKENRINNLGLFFCQFYIKKIV